MTPSTAAESTVRPTLTAAEAAGVMWDVLVVGAGPAGSATALASRRVGLSTLLVDRAQFPRWKVCGCCINTRAQAALSELGLGDLPQRNGAVPTPTLELASGKAHASLDVAGGVALSRERFDSALIRAVIDKGAAFLPAVDCTPGNVTSDARAATLRANGEPHVVNARVIVLATGLADRTTEAIVGPATVARRARIGAAVVLPPSDAGDGWARGRIYMAVSRGGYVGAVRLEDDRLEIAASFDPRACRNAGGPGAMATRIFASVGWGTEVDLKACAWRGTPYLTRRRDRLGAERLLLVGDAAGYVEPFTGEGMAWALKGGAMLGEHLGRVVAKGWSPACMGAWEQACHQAFAGRHRTCRRITRMLRSPLLTAAAIRAVQLLPRAGRTVARSISPALADVHQGMGSA